MPARTQCRLGLDSMRTPTAMDSAQATRKYPLILRVSSTQVPVRKGGERLPGLAHVLTNVLGWVEFLQPCGGSVVNVTVLGAKRGKKHAICVVSNVSKEELGPVRCAVSVYSGSLTLDRLNIIVKLLLLEIVRFEPICKGEFPARL